MLMLIENGSYSQHFKRYFNNFIEFKNARATSSQTELKQIPYNTTIYLDITYISHQNPGYKQGNFLRMNLNANRSSLLFPEGFFFKNVYMAVGATLNVRTSAITPSDDYFRLDGYNSSIASSANQFLLSGFIFWD